MPAHRSSPSAANPTSTASTRSASGTLELAAGSTPGGFAQGQVAAGSPQTIQTLSVCSHGGPVVVTAVRLTDAHGLRLADWGHRAFSGGTGGEPGLARRLGWTHGAITSRCASSHADVIAVSVERTGPKTGTVRKINIQYLGGTLNMRFGIALCATRCERDQLARVGDS
jgi:hypothetical protein